MSTEPQVRIPTVRAIARDRVDALIERAWSHRLTLVIAPPGAGKTTAVAAFATRSAHPVAWIGYPTVQRSGEALLSEVELAVRRAVPDIGGPRWVTVADAALAMHDLAAPLAIVDDDVHRLAGTPAERGLADLIGAIPDHVHVVLAGRRRPQFDLESLDLAGQVLSVDGDELRFRTWEAERLFREQYGTFLPPDDVARVARQVDGWAAGLQLFHLASRGRDPAAQRQLIDQMHGRNRMVRHYLATNVIEPLDTRLRDFLVDTCVLGVVTPDLADEIRGASDAGQMLPSLAESQLFTAQIDERTYRYHDVLRSHLEQLLVERDGTAATAERFRLAGLLQEQAGWAGEALRCYARAGDWTAVRSLLEWNAEQVGQVAATRALFDVLPSAVIVDDPWLLLARARIEIANGQFDAAAATLDDSLNAATSAELAATCRAERAALFGLIRPGAAAVGSWATIAHGGMRRNPAPAAEQLGSMGPAARVSGALLLVIAGDCALAAALAERAFADPAANDFTRSAALGLQAVVRLVRAEASGERNLDEAAEYADRLGVGWVVRILRAAEALTERPSGVDNAVRAADQAGVSGDEWGAALALTFAALGQARRGGSAGELFDRAQRRFARLGADAAAATCALGRAIHQSTDLPGAVADARQHGVAAAESILRQILGERGPRPALPVPPPSAATLEMRVLGAFELLVDGHRVDLAPLRPKARTLFKVLAIAGGQAVPRDAIIEAVWPAAEPDAALHNLQVAVSAVRRLLATAAGGAATIARSGTSYRLDLGPAGDALDVRRFESLVGESRRSSATPAIAAAAAQAALALYRGELLAEDGPAEWLQRPRALRAAQHEQLAVLVAHDHLGNHRAAAAIDVCEAGLLHHPYCDELWRTLVTANRDRGDVAAANLAEARYAMMLDDLSR